MQGSLSRIPVFVPRNGYISATLPLPPNSLSPYHCTETLEFRIATSCPLDLVSCVKV